MTPEQLKKLRLVSPIAGLTFNQPKLIGENYFAGTEGEESVEDWQIWFEIIHDGTNPFLQLGKNKGWRFGFVKATAERIFIPPDKRDLGEYIFFLHPSAKLRAIIISETLGDSPGLYMFCRTDGMPEPKFWFGEQLLSYSTV